MITDEFKAVYKNEEGGVTKTFYMSATGWLLLYLVKSACLLT